MTDGKQNIKAATGEYLLEKPVEETILYDKPTPQIARISLNRPKKHNALYFPQMAERLVECLKMAIADDEVKAIILRGNGPSFCTGDDMNRAPAEAFGLKPGGKLDQASRLRGFWNLYESQKNYLLYCPKCTIASVQGWAMGVGYEYAIMCDLVVATESAKFNNVNTRLGQGGITTLLDILHFGPKRARELKLSGETLSSRKMMEWGLVNSVVPDDKLEEETMRWAKMICLNAADGLMTMKMNMQIIYEACGVGTANQSTAMSHAMFTNLVWHPDEQNFLKLRNQVGTAEAFREREARWAELGF